MDKRTLRRILKEIQENGESKTNIDGYRYRILIDGDEVVLSPRGGGDTAYSVTPYSDYAFTNGGPIFRLALQAAKAIRDALVNLRAGSDAPPAFLNDLEFNDQWMRFFDEKGCEYDLAPANAAIVRKEKIFQVTWIYNSGKYEITHIFNE
jgi:hypothetical protein